MKKIFLLAFGIIAFINLFSQTNIENYIEGRKFKNAESGVIMEYGYIPSLNTKGISYTNQNGKDYVFCSKKISSDGTYMVLTRCIDQQNESVSGTMYFYRTKVIVKEPDSDRRLQFDLVDGNKNITTSKKKTTNNNDDMLSTILSLYQKQVLSDARSINKSSGNLDLGNAGLSKNASYNAYQCRYCGKLSMSKKQPLDGELGRCLKDYLHSWSFANTSHGLQCRYCGIKSHFIKSDGTPQEMSSEFGGGCEGKNSFHSWNKF
jgi:hypothetical protein